MMTPDSLSEEFAKQAESDSPEDIIYLEDTTVAPTKFDPHRSPKRIDYERIRAQYIIGKKELHEDGTTSIINYTIVELCTIHGVYLPFVKTRSAKEKWSLQRAAYKARLQENAENTALNIYLHEGAVSDTQAMIATNKLNKIYKMALTKYDSVIEAYDTDRALDAEETIDIKELKDLLAIGKDLHTLSQQVVKSRTALVERDMVKDLKQYKTQALAKKTSSTADQSAIQDRIAHLQNILATAVVTTEDKP